jgi:tetratricopeptide (TPR) repeat protein
MRSKRISGILSIIFFCSITSTPACTREPPIPIEILQARAATAAGNANEARKILEAAEARHLESPAFSYELALLSFGYFDDFFSGQIRTIIIDDPNYKIFGRATRVRDMEGRELGFHLRDLSPVIEILDRAISRDPKHAGAWLQKANCLAEMNRVPAALETLSNAQKHLPNDSRFPFFAGTIYAHEERQTEAERSFREAREKDSRDVGAALYHGLTLLALNQPQEAEKALARTISLARRNNPKDSGRALYEMFNWYYENQQYERAYSWGKRYLSMVRNTDKLFRALAIAAFMSGHYKEANSWLGEAIRKGGEDALVLALYGQLHVSNGKYAEAEELFKRSLRHKETIQVLSQLGSLYLEKLNSPTQAIQMLERAIAIQPGHFLARYQLANAYRAAGRDEATELAAWNAYLSIVEFIDAGEHNENEKEYIERARQRVQELGGQPRTMR